MKLSDLRRIIKEELLNSLKENTTTTKPGTKEKEETGTKPKRRSLVPDKDKAPNPRPKAMMKENEKQMVDKIFKRFKGLSK
jgi:hypothetical protein